MHKTGMEGHTKKTRKWKIFFVIQKGAAKPDFGNGFLLLM
jgi:hypothetical protein